MTDKIHKSLYALEIPVFSNSKPDFQRQQGYDILSLKFNAQDTAEIPEAIRKGKEDAMKNIITVALNDEESITHDMYGKFGSATVLLKNAPEGTGVIAGGPARAVIEMAGIKNIRTKSLGSNNKQNVVLATIEGLKGIKAPEDVARLRGKSIEEIMG